MLWLSAVTAALVSGVSVHINTDMPIALEAAYRSYSSKYCDAPPFDSFYPDFFENNKPIFKIVRARLISELQAAMGMGIIGPSVDPEFAGKVADKVNFGLKIDEIYEWRGAAWATARDKLATAPR